MVSYFIWNMCDRKVIEQKNLIPNFNSYKDLAIWLYYYISNIIVK